MLSEWTNEFFTQDPFVTRSFYNFMSIPGATLISLGYTLLDYSPWRFTFCIYCKTNNCLFEWQHLSNRLCSIKEKSFSWQNFLCRGPVLQRLARPIRASASHLFSTPRALSEASLWRAGRWWRVWRWGRTQGWAAECHFSSWSCPHTEDWLLYRKWKEFRQFKVGLFLLRRNVHDTFNV